MGRGSPCNAFCFNDLRNFQVTIWRTRVKAIADRADRVTVAESLLKVSEPLWFAVECLHWFGGTDDPERESKNTLTKQEVGRALQVLAQRIKVRAGDGHPLFDPDVQQELSLLVTWSHAEGRDPVQAHLVSVFERDPNQVSRFLRSEVPLAWGVEDGRQSISDLTENELKNIEFLIDLEILADWVRRCCPGNFDEPQYSFDEGAPVERRLAEQFMCMFNRRNSDEEST